MHWLSEHAAANLLLDEVESESDRVWNFIIAREIETPDRFRAIQSYRCGSCFAPHDGQWKGCALRL